MRSKRSNPIDRGAARSAVTLVALAAAVWAVGVTPALAGGDGATSSDVDGDGRDDISIEYELLPDDSDVGSIWYVNADRVIARWWESAPNGWDRDRSHPVSGDFDGDGVAEFAAVYDYPATNSQAIWAFERGAGFPTVVWESAGSDPIGVTEVRVLSGDFDGDGFDDVAVFGDTPFEGTRVMWVPGSEDGLADAHYVWESKAFNWDLGSSKVAAGDIEGDGDDELVILYQYSTDVVGLWAMPGTPLGPAAPLARWNSCQFCWRLEPTHLAVGDFDGDHIDDIGMLYGYDDGSTGWWVVPGWDLFDGGFPVVEQWWRSAPGNFDSSRVKYVVADHDGDDRDEVVGMYRYTNTSTRFWTFDLDPTIGVQVDVLLPPLMFPGVAGWGPGTQLSMFAWDRVRLM